jgi:lactoylglutathione lyase
MNSDEWSLPSMKYLHTMIRVSDPKATIAFFELLGLKETGRYENQSGRFTLIFLAAPGDEDAQVELTHNWDESGYDGGRNFGHLAYRVEDIYATCQRLVEGGVTINRPPRDGHMAFVRTPDNISIELLQAGKRLEPAEPWASMANVGSW